MRVRQSEAMKYHAAAVRQADRRTVTGVTVTVTFTDDEQAEMMITTTTSHNATAPHKCVNMHDIIFIHASHHAPSCILRFMHVSTPAPRPRGTQGTKIKCEFADDGIESYGWKLDNVDTPKKKE